MDRLRTILALAGATLMIAVAGFAGTTGARAEDFQSQGSHLNDPANKRTPDPAANKNNPDFQGQGSHLNDPANARNVDEKTKKPDVK
jgi:hypothetical protein